MPKNRDHRQLEEGAFYHVCNRGNRKTNIALDEEDFAAYQDFLYESFSRYEQELINFIIMINHFHFTCRIIDSPDIFLSLMKSFFSRSSKCFNKKYGTVGHLFQDKYTHRKADNDADLLSLSAYIHRNPVKHGFLEPLKLESYPWSSLSFYLDQDDKTFKKEYIMKEFKSTSDYLEFVIRENSFCN